MTTEAPTPSAVAPSSPVSASVPPLCADGAADHLYPELPRPADRLDPRRADQERAASGRLAAWRDDGAGLCAFLYGARHSDRAPCRDGRPAADHRGRRRGCGACSPSRAALQQNFVQLVLCRIGVGIGEAGCTPPAHSLITDYTPKEKRASALAFYSLGIPLGRAARAGLGRVDRRCMGLADRVPVRGCAGRADGARSRGRR